MKSKIGEYCKELKPLLICPPKDAKRCIADIRKTAKRYQQEQPGITMDDILKMLGDPEDVAEAFLATLDSKQVERYRHRKKLFSRLFLCAAALFVAVSVYRVYYYMVNPPGFSCTTEVYISEPVEIAPGDPRGICPYDNESAAQRLVRKLNGLYIEIEWFLSDLAESARNTVSDWFG